MNIDDVSRDVEAIPLKTLGLGQYYMFEKRFYQRVFYNGAKFSNNDQVYALDLVRGDVKTVPSDLYVIPYRIIGNVKMEKIK